MGHSTFRPEDFEKDWQCSKLSNQMTAVHAPLPFDSRLYVGMVVRAGSRQDPKVREGLAHFLEHMMFRGSRNYPSFATLADAFEWLGGEWNAATSQEYTEFSYSGPLASLPKTLDLFSEFMQFPLLLDIEKERQVILREIEDELNEFGFSTDLSWHMNQLMWPQSTLAQEIAGSPASVNQIAIDDLQLYRQTFYQPANLVLSVVGGPSQGKTFDLIREKFASYDLSQTSGAHPLVNQLNNVQTAHAAFLGPAIKFVPNHDNQYQVQLSFQCEGEWSHKTGIYELITSLLVDGFSARLSHKLREELGLVYDVDAGLSQYNECGSLDISASVTADKVQVFLDELVKALVELKTNGPGDKELAKVQLRFASDLDLYYHSPSSLGFRLAWHSLWGQEVSVAKEKRTCAQITPAQIKEVCRELFKAQNCGLVVMGPKHKGLKEQLAASIQSF